jgi:hypothetical protein
MKLLLILLFLGNCDLENRYPDEGNFCVPMKEIPRCIDINFREKKVRIDSKDLVMDMTNRVQYTFLLNNQFFDLEVHSEHRVVIKSNINSEWADTYIRKKGKKVSLGKRIKDWWNR